VSHVLYLSLSSFFSTLSGAPRNLPSFPTRRSSDLLVRLDGRRRRDGDRHDSARHSGGADRAARRDPDRRGEPLLEEERRRRRIRSEEHTSELQSLRHLVCRLLLEKKKKRK